MHKDIKGGECHLGYPLASTHTCTHVRMHAHNEDTPYEAASQVVEMGEQLVEALRMIFQESVQWQEEKVLKITEVADDVNNVPHNLKPLKQN